MGFYTINDLRDKLYTYPCSSEKNYISYGEGRLIEIINRDFGGEKLFEEKKIWNDEVPMVWGIANTPYSKEAEAFAKSKKQGRGGRKLIVMNEAYFFNAYYIIEKRYWDLRQDTFKVDTRANIRDTISNSVMTMNESELCHAIRQLLNNFLSRLNKEIASLNDFFECKCSQFHHYLTFYKSSYVQQCIAKPEGLLLLLEMQKDTMTEGFKSLSVPHENLNKFLDNILQLSSEENYTDEEKIHVIVDRIYNREANLIKKLEKVFAEFEAIKAETYRLEDAIKIKTEELIKSSKKVFPGSLIIDHAQNNGLLRPSFKLSA